jgi:hypothetical protein
MNNVKWWEEFLETVQKNASNPEIKRMTPEEINQVFETLPYRFNPASKTRTYAQALKDNNGACAEAAAAVAANLSLRKIPFEACFKFDELTGAAHIVIMANGRTFDPYKNFYPAGVHCVQKPQFFPL